MSLTKKRNPVTIGQAFGDHCPKCYSKIGQSHTGEDCPTTKVKKPLDTTTPKVKKVKTTKEKVVKEKKAKVEKPTRRIHADKEAAKRARKVIRAYFDACNRLNYAADIKDKEDIAKWARTISRIEDNTLDAALETFFG